MWNRAGLKANAKENLKRYYWPAFLVCIISGIFNGGGGSYGGYNNIQTRYDSQYSSFQSFKENLLRPDMLWLIGIVASVGLIVILISIAVSLLVGNPLLVGKNRYFMCSRDVKTGVGEIGFAFSCGYFWNIVKIMFLMNLYIFLWSLLLVIPGIIKSYEYAMVPYILAENPGIDSKRAFELSKEMMMGEKWNYFVLGLSFIGWYLLGFLACCIGVVFVSPYYEATMAEFYGWAREKMIAVGYSNHIELKGFGEGVEF
ncbi:MAG: DUF975 family protein [Candidatus Galacturonibacter soehngenii]|nr:DUF975 family protein [Candidatus Galacturonibacter soehngenii]